MPRTARTSVTQLVKDIAHELIEEHIKDCHAPKERPGYGRRTGDTWRKSDDDDLRRAFDDFICDQAKHHDRSYTAIWCRIRDKIFG